MKRVSFLPIAILASSIALTSILFLSSCEGEAKLNKSGKPIIEAELVLFYPDGAKDTLEVFDVSFGSSNERVHYKTMDNAEHSTIVPYILNYK